MSQEKVLPLDKEKVPLLDNLSLDSVEKETREKSGEITVTRKRKANEPLELLLLQQRQNNEAVERLEKLLKKDVSDTGKGTVQRYQEGSTSYQSPLAEYDPVVNWSIQTPQKEAHKDPYIKRGFAIKIIKELETDIHKVVTRHISRLHKL